MFSSNTDSLGYQSFKGASWALVSGLHLGDTIKGLSLVLGPLFNPGVWACFLGPLFNTGHYARECRFKKIQKSEVNVFNENDDIVVVISEVNAIQGKISGWWYGTSATVVTPQIPGVL